MHGGPYSSTSIRCAVGVASRRASPSSPSKSRSLRSRWLGCPSSPARRVLAALLRAGFRETRRRGSHRFLVHPDGRVLLFAVHESERMGPKLLVKILKDARISQEQFRQLL